LATRFRRQLFNLSDPAFHIATIQR
jgi:hypothetical protein